MNFYSLIESYFKIITYERPRWKLYLKKEIWVPFGAPLSLGKWYEIATYFSYKKKKKK